LIERALSWQLSTTQDISMYLEAREDAFDHDGQREIFYFDQATQFTSADWVNALASRGVNISMVGKNQWVDHVFIARCWGCSKDNSLWQ